MRALDLVFSIFRQRDRDGSTRRLRRRLQSPRNRAENLVPDKRRFSRQELRPEANGQDHRRTNANAGRFLALRRLFGGFGDGDRRI